LTKEIVECRDDKKWKECRKEKKEKWAFLKMKAELSCETLLPVCLSVKLQDSHRTERRKKFQPPAN
jgi:hypothetical protein